VAGTPTTNYQIVPTSEAPSQAISITLGGQACLINFYTKSINIPKAPSGTFPQPAPPAPPVYENINPCFVDVYVGSGATLIIGGVQVRQGSLIVRDTYLGFVGDLAVYDTSGLGADPFGIPPRLPPYNLRNAAQLAAFSLADGDLAPAYLAGRIPGMGSRFILTYWTPGTYTPGYSLPI
jgi:hypothetical protein